MGRINILIILKFSTSVNMVYISIYVGLFFFSIFKKFIFTCVGCSLLGPGFPSSCGEQGLLFVEVHGLLIAVASLVVEHGL